MQGDSFLVGLIQIFPMSLPPFPAFIPFLPRSLQYSDWNWQPLATVPKTYALVWAAFGWTDWLSLTLG